MSLNVTGNMARKEREMAQDTAAPGRPSLPPLAEDSSEQAVREGKIQDKLGEDKTAIAT